MMSGGPVSAWVGDREGEEHFTPLRTSADFLVDLTATPNGCERCGELERGHGADHGYLAPPDALRLARMKARRETRLNPPPQPAPSPDTYVTLTADTSDWADALQYTLDALCWPPPRPPEPAAERFRGIIADRLGQSSVLAIGTPGPPGGIYDQHRQRQAAESEAADAAGYLLEQYRQGRERLDGLTLHPPQPQAEQFPSRMRVADGPWIPCRVVGSGAAAHGEGAIAPGQFQSQGNWLHLDSESRDPSPFELMRNFEVTFSATRESLAALGPVFASVGEAIRELGDALGPQDASLELTVVRSWAPSALAAWRDEDWPAPDGTQTCAHVCGPDPGHACEARATTTLRHRLPSGGTRTLPLCRPCADAETAAAEVGC